VVVGISKDSLASHAKFRARHGFTFPLLADTETSMLQAYGAWGEKKSGGKVSMGTVRTTVVVGESGLIERVYPKVKAKGHAGVVLGDMGGS
jgi:peroxiredoxin Q/BCP